MIRTLNAVSWFAAHTNKRGITLNLDTADGRALWLAPWSATPISLWSRSHRALRITRHRLSTGERMESAAHLDVDHPFWPEWTVRHYRRLGPGRHGHGWPNVCAAMPTAHRCACAHAGLSAGRTAGGSGHADGTSLPRAQRRRPVHRRLHAACGLVYHHPHAPVLGSEPPDQRTRWALRVPSGTSRRIVFPCQDGHVALMGVMNAREWGPMVEWLASEGMAEDLTMHHGPSWRTCRTRPADSGGGH